ncbi:sigma-E factor negative regulatory protein [Tahibacter harae]|uniref:Sigma-E factor negative regulatory protein n=1 Tax=Tahibacter harae TaxID=2963937 RepID=A0ABT1QKY1_9GAMM|nr:sigma-E factor negative regulatory protein [Tahibacter harae]MCQ4163193.1 sigma-E factor negative regulatory protein [Tahibacter harae]
MSTETKEQLSALMDGEVRSDAARFVLRSVGSEKALAASWSRYHIARDVLQRQPVLLADAGFAAAVMQQLEAETAAAQAAGGSRWLRYLSGGAVAAAVAVVALMASAPRQDNLAPANRGVIANSGGAAAVSPPARAPAFNDSVLQSRAPLLAQPASATIGGETLFAPAYDLRSQPSNGWRPAANLAERPNAPYVLLIVPVQPAPPAEKAQQPRLQ